ncbi:MAG: AEC family transporter [Clostridiaceae bacterium]
MNLNQVYTQLAALFITMFLGYMMGKFNIIKKTAAESFSEFVINVALPAITISGMNIPLTSEKLDQTIWILALSIPAYGLAFIAGIISARLLTKDRAKRNVYIFALLFSNSSYMGLPVFQSIYGKESIFYVILYGIPFNILFFTLGIKLMSNSKEENAFDWKVFINPGLIATFGSLALFLMNLQLPALLTGTLDMVGNTCVPLSMIVIGVMLSELPLKEMLANKGVYIFTIVRLVVLPLLTLILFKYIFKIQDKWLLAVPIIVSGMPVGTSLGMLAKKYNNNETLSSQTILISTLFSCLTIPLLIYLL